MPQLSGKHNFLTVSLYCVLTSANLYSGSVFILQHPFYIGWGPINPDDTTQIDFVITDFQLSCALRIVVLCYKSNERRPTLLHINSVALLQIGQDPLPSE